MDTDALAARVREICLALPGVGERTSRGAPSFFAGEGRSADQFLVLWASGHHGDVIPPPVVRGAARGAGGDGGSPRSD